MRTMGKEGVKRDFHPEGREITADENEKSATSNGRAEFL